MTGKGDRPRKVDQHKFADNWDKIFRGHMTISEPNASRIRDFFAEEDKYFPLTAQVSQARWYAVCEEEYIEILNNITEYTPAEVQAEVAKQDHVLLKKLKSDFYEA